MNSSVIVAGKFTPVIVKVKREDYVPEGFTVRARISGFIYTANCENAEALESARRDVLVESVELSAPT